MYHFIGIKGAGMSSLACILKELGYEVEGSDLEKHFFTEEGLKKNNIKILPYNEENIKPGMKIIRGASIDDEHPELKKAFELDLKIFSYNEMVGILTKKFKTICISGCHGKTTTTSMMAYILNQIEGTNYLIGDGTGHADINNEYLVLEACEYRRHFLAYFPEYTIITNIDLDHVDYYKDIDDVIDAYTSFALKTNKMVIACGDDQYTHMIKINKPVFYYGLDDDNDIIAKEINYKTTGTSFEVEVEGNYYGFFDLPVYGKVGLLDALAVIAICYYERLEAKEVAKIFKTFPGAKRRFTETKLKSGIIIDDYAHHPNEIKSVIKSAKQKYPDKKIIAIFQPHTFSRTKEFSLEFAKALNLADKAYVLDIHPSREKQEDYPEINSSIIIDELENGECFNINKIDEMIDKDTIYLFMSPNDLSEIENILKEKLNDL